MLDNQVPGYRRLGHCSVLAGWPCHSSQWPAGARPTRCKQVPGVVGTGIIKVKLCGLVEVLYRPLVLTKLAVRRAPAAIGVGVLWVEADGFIEVFYGPLVLTQFQSD